MESLNKNGVSKTTEIFNVVIPEYLEQVEIVKSQQPKYYKKRSIHNLPKNILSKLGSGEYQWLMVKNKGECLHDKNGVPVYKSAHTIGKPKVIRISGQIFWAAGDGSQWVRLKIKDALTVFFTPFLSRQLPNKLFVPKGNYIQLEFIFFVPATRKNFQDDDNHAFPYVKAFRDTLQVLEIIPDDGPANIVGSYSRYVFVGSESERRLEVKIHSCRNGEPIYHEPISTNPISQGL